MHVISKVVAIGRIDYNGNEQRLPERSNTQRIHRMKRTQNPWKKNENSIKLAALSSVIFSRTCYIRTLFNRIFSSPFDISIDLHAKTITYYTHYEAVMYALAWKSRTNYLIMKIRYMKCMRVSRINVDLKTVLMWNL